MNVLGEAQKKGWVDLSVIDKKCLYSIQFWRKLIEEVESFKFVGELIQLLAYENPYISEIITYVLTKGLYRTTIYESANYLEAAFHLLQIQDSL